MDKEKSDSSEEIVDTYRVIGLRRRKGESLVSREKGEDRGGGGRERNVDTYRVIGLR